MFNNLKLQKIMRKSSKKQQNYCVLVLMLLALLFMWRLWCIGSPSISSTFTPFFAPITSLFSNAHSTTIITTINCSDAELAEQLDKVKKAEQFTLSRPEPWHELGLHGENRELPKRLEAEKKEFGKIEKQFTYAYIANGTLASALAQKVRVFCWIATNGSVHESRARHVRATWAQHCDAHLFFSSENDPTLPAVDTGIPLVHKAHWRKSKWSAKHIYANYLNSFDWFYRVDDDAYAIIENLRLLLLPYSPEDSIYFGHKLLYKKKPLFPQGGSGYVLSRATLKVLVEQGIEGKKCYGGDSHDENQLMSACLQQLGCRFGDSRDSRGRHRFLGGFVGKNLPPISLWDSSNGGLQGISYHPITQGPECCSDYLIAFHYVDSRALYLFEYMFYHARVYGARTMMAPNDAATNQLLADAKQAALNQMGPDEPTRNKD